MAAQDKEAFLSRWSRLKQEREQSRAQPLAEESKEEAAAPALPPVDKLTPESDFAPFMHPKVADALRRVALKKLFLDPHFNVPDAFRALFGRLDGRRPDLGGAAQDAEPGAHGAVPRGRRTKAEGRRGAGGRGGKAEG